MCAVYLSASTIPITFFRRTIVHAIKLSQKGWMISQFIPIRRTQRVNPLAYQSLFDSGCSICSIFSSELQKPCSASADESIEFFAS
ncbi:hypothetical protein A3C37_00405 [Candidatus Peribacteria bacterium RIFCSPHIGHO2_02_FULL_53_20]|nr:MAG: hypothetical protein A3C37_00405 [Candidatus Peribacteria bacterium RIFCSPHIGHO2_02_FULL_53_20]OGJ67064.1 MAG: hypothetical protein A3B61_03545 [Candidatus Peribacteria bacterium RIFCSPLOWO2_01_FULL_53_10]OGJ71231.1 MAG: hypothetical protein A3G69_05140 [Candidatus Peribacteria bacterium RIFCSPLOWO2_12_FULL_53_10]